MQPTEGFLRGLLLIVIAVLFTGCAKSMHDYVPPPVMTAYDSEVPMQDVLIDYDPDVFYGPQRMEMEDTSIWNKRDAIYFRDRRAYKPGDILTVRIEINDSARIANRSAFDASGKGGVGFDAAGDFFGHSISSSSIAGNVNASGESESGGTVNRAEKIQLQIAAAVVKAAPNGNLLVAGSQEVRVNNELRILRVQGIVRSTDILSDNSIPYEKIAEARISYGGRQTRKTPPAFQRAQLRSMHDPGYW